SAVDDAGRVTASTRPRMQAAQPVSHSSQKMPESPGTSAKTNPSPPQTNSPTTILVFHFFPMTGLSLMRLGAGRARLPVSGCDRSVTPRYPAAPARTSPESMRWARLGRPRQRTTASLDVLTAASLDLPCRCAAGPTSPRPALVLTATEHVALAQRRHGPPLHRKGHEHGKARLADHRRGSAHRSRIR